MEVLKRGASKQQLFLLLVLCSHSGSQWQQELRASQGALESLAAPGGSIRRASLAPSSPSQGCSLCFSSTRAGRERRLRILQPCTRCSS